MTLEITVAHAAACWDASWLLAWPRAERIASPSSRARSTSVVRNTLDGELLDFPASEAERAVVAGAGGGLLGGEVRLCPGNMGWTCLIAWSEIPCGCGAPSLVVRPRGARFLLEEGVVAVGVSADCSWVNLALEL